LKIQEELNLKNGFEVIIHKNKTGSGLGSSAASAAGAAWSQLLLGNILSKEEMIYFAMFGEELASGVKHADNITLYFRRNYFNQIFKSY
jgi:homoserine kinase